MTHLATSTLTGLSVVNSNSHFDCVTIKYNSAGQEQWVVRYTAPSGHASGDAIALDSLGNVYVAAEAAIPDEANTRFCVTIKYNAAGQQQWIAEYDGGMNSNRPTAIAVDGAANVYVTGTIRFCPVFGYLTIKYDSAGQEQWVARYQGPGTGGDSANAIAIDGSGNVYVTGDTYTSRISSSTVKYDSVGQHNGSPVTSRPITLPVPSRLTRLATCMSPEKSGTQTPILTMAQLSTTRLVNRSGWHATARPRQIHTTVLMRLLLMPRVMYT